MDEQPEEIECQWCRPSELYAQIQKLKNQRDMLGKALKDIADTTSSHTNYTWDYEERARKALKKAGIE